MKVNCTTDDVIPVLDTQLYEHCDFGPSGGCHPSLGSRNFIKLASIKIAVLC
ncbi:hypothetical protein [Wolbachia endosymbiont of Oedothorax gibbosus]|uniref:hypothetical protein n=1 Tax=Wolbachia endosymbiont of Oedothorax gibbosus TaxID=931100 RepID=UPI00202522C1|nr:hypothetical protein [Wolbachia endosymbiont of Oedothorax gibbosus]